MIEILATVGVFCVLLWGLYETWKDWRKRKQFVLSDERYVTGDGRRAMRTAAAPRGMTGKAKTSLFLIVIVAAMLGWEAFALTVIGPGATISEVYWKARTHFPLDFFVGFLCGHLMWQSRAFAAAVDGK